MKQALVPLGLLLVPHFAHAFSASALVCFDNVQTADSVVASGQIDDTQVGHIHSMAASDLTLLNEEGAILSPLLAGEHAHSYLSRMLARLQATAPRLARKIIEANLQIKSRVAVAEAPAGNVVELEDTVWRGSPLDQNLCVLAPVISGSGDSRDDSGVHLDKRLYKKSALSTQSRAVLLLHAYIAEMSPQATGAQITSLIGLFLALNPDVTYDAYLRQIGEQGLLADLPPDGKVWAAPGYERVGAVVYKLIDEAYPYLQDETVGGGKALRINLEAFADTVSPGFACPRKDIPQPSDASGSTEDPDFTCFRACSEEVSGLLNGASEAARKQGENLLTEVSRYLTEKNGVASGKTLASYLNPENEQTESLQQQLLGFKELTAEDQQAIDNGIGILSRTVGESVGQDGGTGKDVMLADPFEILRQTPLHYLTATIPQFGDKPLNIEEMRALWGEVPGDAP